MLTILDYCSSHPNSQSEVSPRRLQQTLCMQDREEAERMFGGEGAAEKTFEPGEGLPEVEAVPADEEMEDVAVENNKGPTPEQITAIKAAIQNAATLQEVAELEKALATGQVPSQFEVSAVGLCCLSHVTRAVVQGLSHVICLEWLQRNGRWVGALWVFILSPCSSVYVVDRTRYIDAVMM